MSEVFFFLLSAGRDSSQLLGLHSGPYHLPSPMGLSQYHIFFRAGKGTPVPVFQDRILYREKSSGEWHPFTFAIMSPNQGSVISSLFYILLVESKFCQHSNTMDHTGHDLSGIIKGHWKLLNTWGTSNFL